MIAEWFFVVHIFATPNAKESDKQVFREFKTPTECLKQREIISKSIPYWNIISPCQPVYEEFKRTRKEPS